MKAQPVRLTNPYPTVLKMARTLGASKSEVDQARRLVEKVMAKKTATPRPAKRAAAR